MRPNIASAIRRQPSPPPRAGRESGRDDLSFFPAFSPPDRFHDASPDRAEPTSPSLQRFEPPPRPEAEEEAEEEEGRREGAANSLTRPLGTRFLTTPPTGATAANTSTSSTPTSTPPSAATISTSTSSSAPPEEATEANPSGAQRSTGETGLASGACAEDGPSAAGFSPPPSGLSATEGREDSDGPHQERG